jgi:hypothetical protein
VQESSKAHNTIDSAADQEAMSEQLRGMRTKVKIDLQNSLLLSSHQSPENKEKKKKH